MDSHTDYTLAKMHPKTLNLSHYRFPSRGQSFISIPSEAFQERGKKKIEGRAEAHKQGIQE